MGEYKISFRFDGERRSVTISASDETAALKQFEREHPRVSAWELEALRFPSPLPAASGEATKPDPSVAWLRVVGLMILLGTGYVVFDATSFAYASRDTVGTVQIVVKKSCGGSKHPRTCYRHTVWVDGKTVEVTEDFRIPPGSKWRIAYLDGAKPEARSGWVTQYPTEWIVQESGGWLMVLALVVGAGFLWGIDRTAALIERIWNWLWLTPPARALVNLWCLIIGPGPKSATTWELVKADPPIAQVVGFCAIAWVYLDSPGGSYFTFLRFAVSGACAYVTYRAYTAGRINWAWVAAMGAVLYNPFAPFHLGKETWIQVNVATLTFFVASMLAFHRAEKSKPPQAPERFPEER